MNETHDFSISSYTISIIIGLLFFFSMKYYACPAATLASSGYFWLIFLTLLVASISQHLIAYVNGNFPLPILYTATGILILFITICNLTGSKVFNAKSYANRITITDGVWTDDMTNIESFNDSDIIDTIALMDSETAKTKGETALSSLSNVVSRYELGDFTQINYNGIPMKVAPLQYASFWKYMKFGSDGISGYVLFNPVNGDTKYVELDTPFLYSTNAYFSRNLRRHLRGQYPDKIFGNSYFELMDGSKQDVYWVTATYRPTVSLWGGTVIDGAIVTNAQTGESDFYDVNNIPDWVDVVFNGDYICKLYNDYGLFSGGFWNSQFSQTNCTECTDDYGYITKDNDIWVYTGITSVVNDSSNIGLLMANERTGEVKYYEVGGADEHSAMAAARGEISNYGYAASFPSVISIHDTPTYIMVLKDANNIVKKYSLVNLEDYSKIVIGDTKEEAFNKYLVKMGLVDNSPEEEYQTNTSESPNETLAIENKENDKNIVGIEKQYSVTITDIIYAVNNGQTYIYIKTDDNMIFKSEFNESLLFLNSNDKVVLNVLIDENTENSPIIDILEIYNVNPGESHETIPETENTNS